MITNKSLWKNSDQVSCPASTGKEKWMKLWSSDFYSDIFYLGFALAPCRLWQLVNFKKVHHVVGLPTSDNFIQSCKRSCFCFGISLFQAFRSWGRRKAMKRLEQATLESFSFINKYSQPRSQGAFSCSSSGKGRTIRKVVGGGGGREIFEPQEFFIKFLVWIFFRP